MIINLISPDGFHRVINTPDLELAGKWLMSWIPEIMEDNYRYRWQIQITPSNGTENSYLTKVRDHMELSDHIQTFINPSACISLSKAFAQIASSMTKAQANKE